MGLFVGVASVGFGRMFGRNEFDPGIGHPGMECAEARRKIERLQQDILSLKEWSRIEET